MLSNRKPIVDKSNPQQTMGHLSRDKWTFPKFNELGLQEFQAFVISYECKTVLLKREDTRWIMPAYVGDDDNYESSFLPEFVNKKVRQEVGSPLDLWVLRQAWRKEMDVFVNKKVRQEVGSPLDLWVLRQAWRKEMDVLKNKEHFFLEKAVVLVACLTRARFAWHKEYSEGKGNQYVYEWVPLEKAEVYHLFPEARRIVAQEMGWVMREKVSPNRLRWQRPGWMESKRSWMKNELFRERGALIVKPIVAERSTTLGTVIEAKTTKGKFFLKCTPPWQNDAAYTEVLSRIAPKFVAPPVAVDMEKQVMITSDYGEILTPALFDEEEEIKLTRDYVMLQKEAAGKVDELVRAGMPDFRADALSKRMDWAARRAMLDSIAERTKYAEAVAFFRKNLDKLKAKVEDLYATGIPATVTHNDLDLSNVYKRKGCENYMFFDWVEGYVAHPLTGVLDGISWGTYIREWEVYEEMEGLEEWLRPGQQIQVIIEFLLRLLEAENVEEVEAGEAIEKVAKGVNGVFDCFSSNLI